MDIGAPVEVLEVELVPEECMDVEHAPEEKEVQPNTEAIEVTD